MFNTVSTVTDRFLADLSNVQDRLIKSQRQVSSGLRLQTVSDDPDHVSVVLNLKARLAHNDQLKVNLSHIETEVNAAEGAINTTTSLMDRARQIASQGANGNTSASTRAQLADQVKDVISQVLGITQANVEGRYVFSGNADNVPPYAAVDLTTANGVGTYQGSGATRIVEHPNGSRFSVSLTADDVFDHGNETTSVLKSLTMLYNDLVNNNAGNLTQDVSNIRTAGEYLNGRQALYGDIQNQLKDGLTYQQRLDTDLQAQLGTAQDADPIAAIVNLQKDTIAQSAALQAHASLPRKSLFDYLG
jgi:flagellar hook-associated protein 3 FlgL